MAFEAFASSSQRLEAQPPTAQDIFRVPLELEASVNDVCGMATRGIENKILEVQTPLVEAGDWRTPEHMARTAHKAVAIAQIMGERLSTQVLLAQTMQVHDVGKKIPDVQAAMALPRALTSQEREAIAEHVPIGTEMVRRVFGEEHAAGVSVHHAFETRSGQSHTPKMSPELARLAAIATAADMSDALADHQGRVYLQPKTRGEIFKIIKDTLWQHPDVVAATGQLIFGQAPIRSLFAVAAGRL